MRNPINSYWYVQNDEIVNLIEAATLTFTNINSGDFIFIIFCLLQEKNLYLISHQGNYTHIHAPQINYLYREHYHRGYHHFLPVPQAIQLV